MEHASERLPVALDRDPLVPVVRVPRDRDPARVDVELALWQEEPKLQTGVVQLLTQESLDVLGRRPAGAQRFEKVGHSSQRVVASAVEAPVDRVLHPRAQRAESDRDHERGGRG